MPTTNVCWNSVDAQGSLLVACIIAGCGTEPAELTLATLTEEPDSSIPGLTTVAPLYPSVLHILVNHDHIDSGSQALLMVQIV